MKVSSKDEFHFCKFHIEKIEEEREIELAIKFNDFDNFQIIQSLLKSVCT